MSSWQAYLRQPSQSLVQMVLGIGYVHFPAFISALHDPGCQEPDSSAMHHKRC